MPAVDSFVGDGLNPSPYKEALARAERAEAERDWMRALLVRALAAFRHVGVVRGVDEWCEECEAALDAARKEGEG